MEKPASVMSFRDTFTQFLSVKCFTRCLFKKEATKTSAIGHVKTHHKRIVLQSAGKNIRPVGFLSPYTIGSNAYYKNWLRRKLSWDDELPPDIHAGSRNPILTDLARGSTVPARDNPADLLTRGISVDALTTNSSGGMDPRFYVKIDLDQRTR
ncbi:hypothetical protein TNCV_1328671 [Trichonephila clavipes]|nr:hypothetical protein TNCV_1328671 [Trichonephila clavipes]